MPVFDQKFGATTCREAGIIISGFEGEWGKGYPARAKPRIAPIMVIQLPPMST
jgi:hypothetical protein